ncbi:MATE family efflux transporter [Ruminococcus sp. 5_1_39BFAA]|uniref:MATE family efflux transporter n=1 Tax=Ruminococcus sp. 5_1_39BFAA TaxID=457412 RepID=UPI003566D15E
MKQRDLTQGSITKNLMLFALPMMAGNLLQQCYNIADTLIVGRYLGANALAAVGSSYTLMTFLTSILLGMCMGSGAVFSIRFGEKDSRRLKEGMIHSFGLIAVMTVAISILVFAGLPLILKLLQVPDAVVTYMRDYLKIIFVGISATFLYNYFAALLRAVGNSVVPLAFLGIAAVLNIMLDLAFILLGGWGVAGAAAATVIAQFAAGVGITAYTLVRFPEFRFTREELHYDGKVLKEIAQLSFLTCLQQSIMNFGILMVQGRVNSFGPAVMAAFAAAVKIDSFAYMPVQDFGNAFSTFVAQNFGAGKKERIVRGIRSAVVSAFLFCVVISAAVCLFAEPLMKIFVQESEREIVAIGVEYLRIEGAFYFGIGLLFLLYGYYRAVKKPGMSVILTIFSLGTRVLLAYSLSSVPAVGVKGIWVSVPIGWALADAVGVIYYWKRMKEKTI